MATKKRYTINTGDTLTDVVDSTGSLLSVTFAKLHIPEYKRTFDITRNNHTGDVVVAHWWKLANVAGDDRMEAILNALKVFFSAYAPIRAH